MLVGLLFIVVGYALPFYYHPWITTWLNWGTGPFSPVALHRYLTFLECLQFFLGILGLNLAVATFTRSKAARGLPERTPLVPDPNAAVPR